MLDLITSNRLPETVLHPATGCDYFSQTNRNYTKSEKANIVDRYGKNQAPKILGALEIATQHTIHHAHNIEMENTTRVIEATRNPEANATAYRELVGDVNRIPEFIRFFSIISADVLGDVTNERTDGSSETISYPKVALGVLLSIQRGDWESTALLDTTFRSLKGELPNVTAAGYKEYNTPGERRTTYRYTRLPGHAHKDDIDMSGFGIINRRRRVADIYGVGLFKQSKGLVVLSELTGERQQLALSTPYGVEDRKGVASTLGRQFEEDIVAEKGISRAIVPVSAHYLMIARKPA